jgi:citrate synthase
LINLGSTVQDLKEIQVMTIHLTKSQIGLDGVPAAETVLSHVDGDRGQLIIAGKRVAELAGKSSFEHVTARLWNGATQRSLSEADVRASLGAARERAFARLPELLPATRGLSTVAGFRTALAGLRGEIGLDHEATILGALPVIAGALVQQAKGHQPVAPNPKTSHAADTLRMLRGRQAEAREVAALEAYRDRLRARHECILHNARCGLDTGRSVCGGHGGLLRIDGSAA